MMNSVKSSYTQSNIIQISWWALPMAVRFALTVLLVLLISALLLCSLAQAREEFRATGTRQSNGALFTMTNSTDRIRGNEIVMYRRSGDGDLTLVGYFPTGPLEQHRPQLGSGPAPTSVVFGTPVPATADVLGSVNALILGDGNDCLFAVNAGSNSVSSFQVSRGGLRLISVVDSRGVFPVSLAQTRSVLYVLNAGSLGSLAGFRTERDCQLTALSGSDRQLGGVTNSFPTPAPVEVLTAPAQISFSPDGTRLALSIKGGPDGNPAPAGRMVVFPVQHGGLLGPAVVTPFNFAERRAGPFGFAFLDANIMLVLHVNSRSIASYRINADHTLSVTAGPFDTGTFAPCWLDGYNRFVYVAHFGEIPATGSAPDGNGVLRGFRVLPNGGLQPTAVSVPYPSPAVGHGNHAIDIKVIGRFLYFLQPRTGRVGRLTINENGALTGMTHFGGLQPGPEPYAGANPGINAFLTRCFLQDPGASGFSPECSFGSAAGIAGF